MYLKNLVLHGFKSFAQRVEIQFSPGVSAVVGPNGSGKSNISDAIRWVLGEQSARQLRGSALQDVIFAGTDQRRPLGMAAVSLTLDNVDGELALPYTEITVTRRIYRSGESEFAINGTACRLRDIHELFMDTGLGRGSMAIIGQGEVDAVLSARPEERRALVEEVAGITRYRTRRREAMQRLEQTEQNLVRLADIIAEVQTRLEPLEREAEKAARHREWSDRLRELELALLYQQWAKRKRTWEARRHDVKTAKDLLGKQRHELERVQQKRQIAEHVLDGAQHRKAEFQDEAQQVQQTLHNTRTQIQVLDERIMGLDQQKSRHHAGSERLQSQHGVIQLRLAELKEAQRDAHAVTGKASESLEQSNAKIDALRQKITAKEAELEGARAKVVGHVQAVADARSQTEQARSAQASAKESAERFEQELQSARNEYAGLAAEAKRVEGRRAVLHKRRQTLATEQTALKEARKRQRAHIAELEPQLDELRARQSQTRSRRDALAELDSTLEGFNESVKACLRANEPWRTHVYGAVGSLLDVPDEYEIAMETALGAAMQNVVVADQRTAEQAIEFLKRTRAGRVTFLPLDALRTPSTPQITFDVMNDPDYIGIGADLVQAPAEITAAVQFLLARVLVARDLRAAVRLMRQVRQLSRAVSLEGDVVLASGPITGGHRRNNRASGVLARSYRIRLLDADLSSRARERQQLETKYETAEASLREVEATLQEIRAQNAALHDDIAAIDRQYDVLRERMAANQRAVERSEAEKARALELQEAAEVALRAATEKLSTTDHDQNRLHAILERLEKELHLHRAELDRLEQLHAERRAAWSEAESRRSGLEQEITRNLAAEKDVQVELQRIGDEIAQVDRLQQSAAQDRQRAMAVLAETEVVSKKLKEQQQAVDHEIEQHLNESKTLQKTEETYREKLDRMAQTVHQAQLALEKEGFALEQIEAGLASFEVQIPDRPDAIEIDLDEDFASEAKKLRQSLDQLGHVNLNALDEFAAHQERYRFLMGQKEDLLQAKEDLENAISEFDATSRTRLQDSLRQIQKALNEVFPRLFGGGKATVGWSDPDDPLESGIDIMVQPKGKRPQALLTLSGGERSLAATALLFAIMSVRPSPFFVLDEIDAALDERNLERFADLLSEFGKKNQIIVITHRQATMEAADTLFGVTMERQGASQLVSLQLADAAVPN